MERNRRVREAIAEEMWNEYLKGGFERAFEKARQANRARNELRDWVEEVVATNTTWWDKLKKLAGIYVKWDVLVWSSFARKRVQIHKNDRLVAYKVFEIGGEGL